MPKILNFGESCAKIPYNALFCNRDITSRGARFAWHIILAIQKYVMLTFPVPIYFNQVLLSVAISCRSFFIFHHIARAIAAQRMMTQINFLPSFAQELCTIYEKLKKS